MKTSLHPETTVLRVAPLNLVDEDNYLFAHEIKRTFESSSQYEFSNVNINDSGVLWKGLSIKKQSRRHIKGKLKLRSRIGLWIKFILPTVAGIKPKLKLNSMVLWATDSWSHGYFHWICDVLPLLEVHAKQNQHATLLLPAYYQNIDFVKHSVALFGFATSYLGENECAQCNRLIVSDLLAPSGNYIPEVMGSLRTRVLSALGSGNKPDRKLFISRSKAPKRNLKNESEVQEVLHNFGFEIVYAEELDWPTQVKLFSESRTVIAQHGAGLTNMLFMPPDGKVLEIRAENDSKNNCYFAMASALDHTYFYLQAANTRTDNDHIGDMLVDIERLKEVVSTME